MGAKKMVDADSLTSVADHIRTKGGTSSPLEFPGGFNQAIDDISTGETFYGDRFFDLIYGEPSNE